MAIGLRKQFLGTNERSYDFLPFLRQQRVNDRLMPDDELAQKLCKLIDDFEHSGEPSIRFQTNGMTCVCEITHFSVRSGGKKQGYLLELRDATEEQRAYDIISSYNETLNAEVVEKTNSIREMQRKIVVGMANMIENRDNNTGGHVKRTSDIIHIIVDEINRQGLIPIDEQLAQDIVRAAPTHDLGKISIDSNILNKPGRFTPEEYEIMKTHSAKSGEMVKILLEGVEEDRFVQVAFNVTSYHHERWDGRGYPEGLVGTQIPLEARIMSVADVYDALVSKRVYKEPMSFEKSSAIMCENMGTQFDPRMKSVFLGCREKLEQYYMENDR
jgi:HD-GYP domain-containing protein (c-di-GMP phosphodiesterase class II)